MISKKMYLIFAGEVNKSHPKLKHVYIFVKIQRVRPTLILIVCNSKMF